MGIGSYIFIFYATEVLVFCFTMKKIARKTPAKRNSNVDIDSNSILSTTYIYLIKILI